MLNRAKWNKVVLFSYGVKKDRVKTELGVQIRSFSKSEFLMH